MSYPTQERQSVKICHVCKGVRVYYLFSACGYRVVRCDDCGLVFFNPQPSDDELARIYDANYFLGSDSEAGRDAVSEIKQATANLYLSEIHRYHGGETGRLLEVGCGEGDFLVSGRGRWMAGYRRRIFACRLRNGAATTEKRQGVVRGIATGGPGGRSSLTFVSFPM